MYYTSGDLATYHAALYLPSSLVKEYSLLVKKWEQCSGLEWTVSRCKEIYVDFIRFKAGLELIGKYKKNRAGLPAGILSHIFKLSLTSKKRRFSCGTLLRSYTAHISPSVLPSQILKWLSGVEAPDVIIPDSITDGVCEGGLKIIGRTYTSICQPSYLSYVPSPGKRVPLSNGKTAPEESHWYHQWETIGSTKTGRFLTDKYSVVFKQVFKGFNRFISGDIFKMSERESVGKIGLIQEPGLKLRAVANPNRVYQMALKPLGDAIYDKIKILPWDCTFDQSKALPAIQKHLSNKKRCHCVDLTGATDYFPLKLQSDVLYTLFPNLRIYISLFCDISRSEWIYGDKTIKWTKGQPLGLYPSFGAFGLTHGLLLYYLNDYRHDDEFFILGDDVVILNDLLLTKYHAALKVLECPISLSKSISSKLIAEFGGKIIDSSTIEPQLKWRLVSDDNFIDIVRLLGPKSLRLLRPQQRQVVKAIWDIPDLFGGLGFNPNGLPLSTRYEKYLELFGNDDGTFLMSYDRKFNSFFNEATEPTSNVHCSNFWNSESLPDLDQRSAALVLKYLPSFIKMYGILGTNLYSVVLNKDSLPIDGVGPRRKTLLAILQSKLGI